jgi:cellulose synthase/poly-beta-1,6-N-acetylglucosamine synthase-like glycosyltransferase
MATLILVFVTAVIAIPALFLAMQIAAAFAYVHKSMGRTRCPRTAVIVPAHNEGAIIERTINSIRAQLPPGGRLLVVADNCTDSTAQLAAGAGAEVSVREDPARIGKGYALDHGLRTLAGDPPEVVLFVDADCEVETKALETIAMLCAATKQPIQARYSMQVSQSAGPLERLSQFAWTVKTFVRPLGSARLGIPCQILGSGMAFPWETIRLVNLATGHIAEDQKLSADLALLDIAPIFCPEAHVVSRFPLTKEAKGKQQTRWEQGHLAVIREYFPRLVARAIAKRSMLLLAFALDLCAPPLSLLVLLLALIECVNMLWLAAAGSIAPVLISSVTMSILVASIGAAWWRFGKTTIPLRDLAAVPAYCVSKLSAFVRLLFNRQIGWVKTDR